MRRLTTLAILAVALAAPQIARADASYPGQRLADPVVQQVAALAGHYWDVKGAPRCDVKLFQAPALQEGDGDAWGRGDGTTCTAWISDDLAYMLANPYGDTDMLETCQAVTHEIGHARGLPHALSGPMVTTGAPAPPREFDNVPWFCVKRLLREWPRHLREEYTLADVPHEMRVIRRYVFARRSGH